MIRWTVILILRTWALWGGNRRMLVFLLTVAGVIIVACSWLLSRYVSDINKTTDGISILNPPEQLTVSHAAVQATIPWILLSFLDFRQPSSA